MTAAMRIGVDARTALARRPRGEGKSLIGLYREMARQHRDWRFILFCERAEGEPFADLPNVAVVGLDIPGQRFNLWEEFILPLLAACYRVDVLHCTSSAAPPFALCPVVTTVHDLIPMVVPGETSAAAAEQFRKGLVRAVRRARYLIAVSEATRSDLIRLLSADRERTVVIHWGADPAPPIPATEIEDLQVGVAGEVGGPPRAPGRHALGAASGLKRYFLAFGGNAPRKNTAGLLRAFRRVREAESDVGLIVVGLHSHSTAAGDEVAGVRLLPYVSEATLESLYRGALALVYPSRYEGFGMPLVEAMARGVAIIAGDRSCLPEVVGDGGLLVDPDDEAELAAAMLRLAREPETLHALRCAAGRRAGAFSWSETARRTADVLQLANRQ